MGENTLKGGTVLEKLSAVKRDDISCLVWALLMGRRAGMSCLVWESFMDRNVSISCLALVVHSYSWVGGLVYHA